MNILINDFLPLYLRFLLLAAGLAFALAGTSAAAQTWTADNGDGTFSNPLFYEEFSDPTMIRVGDDFYLTGTTMHAMPGLPVLHSRDLVNWRLLSYAANSLDLGPAFRLEQGKNIYGQGIWAPSFVHHAGVFYIFSNINGYGTQVFRATNPRGPWSHSRMKRAFHDLSVLFDDDERTYVVWGYDELRIGQLNAAMDDVIPETVKVILPKGSGIGEGAHFYKIDGKYYILGAWWDGRMRMPAARAPHPYGPWEVNPAISLDENFGLGRGYRLNDRALPRFEVRPQNGDLGRNVLHQGGIIDTAKGEWWGYSMQDYDSLGRLTSLSPVTWRDGWPYFGLPGNLGRTPRSWIKPDTGVSSEPFAPYVRDDDFSGPALANVWQWNHVPANGKWSLTERPGYLRLHTQPAADFWQARNSLTQRAIGPASQPTTVLDTSGFKEGDTAGLALLSFPYFWLGVEKTDGQYRLVHYNQLEDRTIRIPVNRRKVWLRADCDFLTEQAFFSYSLDGKTFKRIGDSFDTIFHRRTFQGVRYALFAFNRNAEEGGHADFDEMRVVEYQPQHAPIPLGRSIALQPLKVNDREHDGPHPQWRRLDIDRNGLVARGDTTEGENLAFRVIDRGRGRVALKTGQGYVSITETGDAWIVPEDPGEAGNFQWVETLFGETMLLSLKTHRYLAIDPVNGWVGAKSPGPRPDATDLARFDYQVVDERE